MKKLTVAEMKSIMNLGTIDQYSEDEKNQVFEFAFGKSYMRSNQKGTLKTYSNI